ncbi:MAG: hypothetical protein DSO03_00075 [Hadesarchaea archaeon]|nr:MAG: hypothetical protein DSO03_00075 [Hadesarchaea archaeon]
MKYLLLALPLVLLLGLGSPVAAETPTKVKVGVWINAIEKVDLPSQTFTIDFYIWFKYKGEKPDIEFLKGTPSVISFIRQEGRNGENYLEYRVKGVYVSSLNFRSFPFDEHLLRVELEDKYRGISELVFEPDEEESGLDPNLTIPGWQVKDFRLSVDEHVYPDENYSKFSFGVTVYRSKISAFFKYFFPILIITLISLLTFSISVKNFGQRVGICVTTLMSAVAYHLTALSGLPSLGYLTLFDRIMLVVYTLFFYNLIVSVQAMRLVEAGEVKRAEEFETKMQNLLPLLVLGLFFIYVVMLSFL